MRDLRCIWSTFVTKSYSDSKVRITLERSVRSCSLKHSAMLRKTRHNLGERWTYWSRTQYLLRLLLYRTNLIASSWNLRDRFGCQSSTLILNCR